MQPAPSLILEADHSIGEAVRLLPDGAQKQDEHILVRMTPTGWNAITIAALRKLAGEGKTEMSLASNLSTRSLPSLFPDLPLDAALRFVQDAPLVPVVNRANFRQVEGVITREDVFRRYREEESE
ncbi:MAG: hypothetical protein DMG90_15785 [Acidobacteria bacterium]|nr:MAG: hypothetical protein DMG90_15785 [Acidobacteriota bacterium]